MRPAGGHCYCCDGHLLEVQNKRTRVAGRWRIPEKVILKSGVPKSNTMKPAERHNLMISERRAAAAARSKRHQVTPAQFKAAARTTYCLSLLLLSCLKQIYCEQQEMASSGLELAPSVSLDQQQTRWISVEEALVDRTAPHSEGRANLEALFRVVNDTKRVEAAQRERIYQLLEGPQTAGSFNESAHRRRAKLALRREVAFEDTIFLKSASQETGAKMNTSLEGESLSDPAIHWMVLHNATTILVVRSANKYYYWTYAQTMAALVIFGFIVVGNLSILYRLKSHRRRRSNVNYFIVQLAIADLLVGIFNVTLDSVLRIQQAFTWGLLACRATKYISSLFIYSSTNLLVALSVDRWEAVVKPLAFTRNSRRGYHLVAGSWLLAVISALPVSYFSRVKEIDGLPQCWIDLDKDGWRFYLIYLASLLLVLPTLIIAICYAHIVYTIWSKARLVSEQQRRRCQQHQLAPADSAAKSNSRNNNNKLDERKENCEEFHIDRQTRCALERTKKSCLKAARLERSDLRRSCTIDMGPSGSDKSEQQQRGQLVKFNGQSSGGKKRAAREPTDKTIIGTQVGQLAGVGPARGGRQHGERVQQLDESPSESQLNPERAPVEPTRSTASRDYLDSELELELDENNNALASSTQSSAAGSISSRSSTSAASSSIEAPTLADVGGVARASNSASATNDSTGTLLVDTLLTCAPDAATSSPSNSRSRSHSNNSGEIVEAIARGQQEVGSRHKRSTRRRARKLAKIAQAPAERQRGRRALSADLGAARRVNLGASQAARASGHHAANRIGDQRERRRSSHSAGGSEAAQALAHSAKCQQSNSMISCDSLSNTAASAMSRLARKSLLKRRDKDLGPARLAGGAEFVAQQHGSGVIPKARIKTIKMTLVIVVAYILCWSPFLILNLMAVFGLIRTDTLASHAIMTLSQSLAHLNSAVNPIIFWLFSSKRHANDLKPATTMAVANGAQLAHSQAQKEAAGRESGRANSKASRLVSLLRELWAPFRWLLTSCNCCLGRPGAYRETDSRMFERTTTTTTNFSQISTRQHHQRSGA